MSLLYLSTTDPLATVAHRVFGALLVTDWEERFSDNYPGGNYFRGKAGEFKITVSRESPDDWFYDEFQILVSITAPPTVPTPPNEAAELAATELVRAGFRVAEQEAFTHHATRWRVFSLDALGNLKTTVLERSLPTK
ncbi:MAG: hypothetical protein LW847_03885 [Burkholderiales bacterium]|jgi:hypothetical protein|nr:hypothetical protein [Burkholderiales bacterium]